MYPQPNFSFVGYFLIFTTSGPRFFGQHDSPINLAEFWYPGLVETNVRTYWKSVYTDFLGTQQ